MADFMTAPESEPTLLVIGRRTRGRPRVLEQKTSLTTWVPTAYHDRIAQLALKHDVSVSKVVCKLLAEALNKQS